MLLEDLARELVESTSDLIGGRVLNVMNAEGVIIASTETDRVGSFHQGAFEAVRSGKVVNIHADELERYPGSKEGCNMPLRINGAIIGVIGIYGNPDEIQDIAHLLGVYATKCYQLEAMMRPRLSESTLRSQLMLYLLSPSGESEFAIRNIIETLDLQIQFPACIAVISAPDGLALPGQSEELCQDLHTLNFLNKRTDIWSTADNRMVLLCSSCDQRSISALTPLTQMGKGYRISFGSRCYSLRDIPGAYQEASTLDRICAESVCDVEEISFKCRYMLSDSAAKEAGFLETLYQKLCQEVPAGDRRVLLESAACYYACDHSVSAAAQKQYVHKNTLQYRLKRLLAALELTDQPAFLQEYVIRLLLDYLLCKTRS